MFCHTECDAFRFTVTQSCAIWSAKENTQTFSNCIFELDPIKATVSGQIQIFSHLSEFMEVCFGRYHQDVWFCFLSLYDTAIQSFLLTQSCLHCLLRASRADWRSSFLKTLVRLWWTASCSAIWPITFAHALSPVSTSPHLQWYVSLTVATFDPSHNHWMSVQFPNIPFKV